jgi:AAA domain
VAWIIARLTQGELPGNLKGRPASVGVIGDEDSFDDVWTPRLHAAGADVGRVHLIERKDGGYVDTRNDRRAVAREVKNHQIRVLFFDQLLDNLGTGVDDWRQKAVRDALHPLRSLGRDLKVAIVGSLHPNKRGDSFRQLMAGTSSRCCQLPACGSPSYWGSRGAT